MRDAVEMGEWQGVKVVPLVARTRSGKDVTILSTIMSVTMGVQHQATILLE